LSRDRDTGRKARVRANHLVRAAQTIYDWIVSSQTAPGSSARSVHHRVAAATGIVMASILLSRVLGFVRVWAVAHFVGANSVTDAFNAAFTLPDMLSYLVAGGSLSITFIPVFAKYAAEGREDEGWSVFSTVISVMGIVLIALAALGELLAEPIVRKIEPGFDPNELARAVFLTRLMLPAQIFFYEGSILSAVQYAKGQFLIPSLAPLIYNASIILGGVLLHGKIGITGFSVGVVFGAVCGNFLLQAYGAVRVGAKFAPNLRVAHPGFVLFLKMSVPIMLALGLAQADDWIMRHYASYLQHGELTWLTYGKMLMQVPLGFVGQAIAVASFPVLAQLYSERKYAELNRLLNDTFRWLIVLLVPISAMMIAESRPMVRVLFLHTRLHFSDLDGTAAALVFFSLGLFSWGAQNILARGFYATRNTVIPAVVGTLTTFCSLPLYRLLMDRIGHTGLALSSSIGITAYSLVLFVLLSRRTQNHEQASLIGFLTKVTAASAVTGFACFKLGAYLETLLPWERPLYSFVLLLLDTSAGVILLLLLLKLLRVSELDRSIRRGVAMLTGSKASRARRVEPEAKSNMNLNQRAKDLS
jgi:putative peptidoglycan lipid II flippase